MNIGGIEVGRYVLGPMAGVTDLTYRKIVKSFGADLVYTEMVSAKGIMYNNKNTEPLITIDESERPVALQLFGSDEKIMSEMAKRIEDRNFDFLDINMGCPVPKVVNNGEGSALMKDMKKAGQIVKAVSRAIKKPVTVKIRKGFYDGDDNAPEMAKILEDSGAAAIAVHARTRQQFYSGEADWDVIRRVKESVGIPVIGNGDVDSPEKALSMFEQTGCDAVMIARAARGNPWIFEQIRAYIEQGKKIEKTDIRTVASMMIYHAKEMLKDKGEYTAVHEMRKHVAWYTAGYPNSAALRRRVNTVGSFEELMLLLTEVGGV
ncbi:MAG: tRNA dihydrouridine synthase DusB [Lachnospiraceae bacterium]|nr:tRNA dihydrouridine synthase DusB [Lachnospiraceae bacterium]